MYKKFLSVFLVIVLCISVVACGGGDSESAEEPEATVEMDAAACDEALQAMIDDEKAPVPGLAVIAVKDKEVVYSKYLGPKYIDNENEENNLPIDENTKFRIASISKVFVAVAIMQLVEKGDIDLDTDISEYLGFELRNPNYPDVAITTRMLLSHTSSIRDGSIYSIPVEDSIEEFFKEDGKYWKDGEHFGKAEDGIEQTPGEYFAYTNLNFGVLATMLEKITNTRFDQYMNDTVLSQMGLDATYNPALFDDESLSNLSPLYKKMNAEEVWDVEGPWIAQIDDFTEEKPNPNEVFINNPDLENSNPVYDVTNYEVGTNGTIYSPQGGLRISATDLTKLMMMFMNDGTIDDTKILEPETVALMFESQWAYDPEAEDGNTYDGLMANYGLSIQIMSSKEADRLVADRDILFSGHFGEAYGLLSGIFMDRESGDGFIYIMNGMGAPEEDNYGEYSGMYLWEEKFCTAILDNLFPEL